MRVLLVEDDLNLRRIGQIALSRYHSVEVAASALEGLEKAKRTNPDLILSDIRMPGVDGTEFLQLLRDDPTTSQIPVIFMTASVQKEQIAAKSCR